jgi:hypothetical protein
MRHNIREKSEGGRARLPSLFGTPAGRGHLLRFAALAAVCLVCGGAVEGQTAQELRQQRQAARRQAAQRLAAERQAQSRALAVRSQSPAVIPGRPNAVVKSGPARRSLDPVAQDLLRKMIRPTTDYVGEMVTQVAAQNNFPLQQTIIGDKQGRTLTTFLNGSLAGDLLLVTPGEVRNYHRRTGITDVALWPNEWDDHEKRMFDAIRNGFYSARVVGSEEVAGRQASIVELVPVAGAGEPGRPQFKFWIDTETGVQLKNEKSDAAGRVLSHRYLTSISIGPNVSLTPKDFNSVFPPRSPIHPLFPDNSQYSSLQQAQGHLPFAPLVPTTLPNGFKVSGVWVFPGGNNQMQFVLLRFTDNVTSFSLYERIVPATAKPIGVPAFNRHIERWRVTTPGGEVEATYTGMLTPSQVQDIYYSLK